MQDSLLLSLNASILWGVVAGLLTWLLRFKTLVLVLLLAPVVIGSTFRHIAGMPELIGFYGVDSGSVQNRDVGLSGTVRYHKACFSSRHR